MNRAVSLYNSQSEGAIHDKVEDYRGRFGDEMAERTQGSLRLLKSNARQDLDEASSALKASFSVTGETHRYDPNTDRYVRGRFSAEGEVKGAAMRFDSETGAAVSVMGGPFRTDFARPVQSQSEPALSPAAAALFDISA
jgi:hypothetical protein